MFPVNASMATSRLAMLDSGSGWHAPPFLYGSFIHNFTPVVPAHSAAYQTTVPSSQITGASAGSGLAPKALRAYGRITDVLSIRSSVVYTRECLLSYGAELSKWDSKRKCR